MYVSRAPYRSEGRLRWQPGHTTPRHAPSPWSRVLTTPPPPGVVGLIPHPSSRPFVAAPPAWASDGGTRTVRLEVVGTALTQEGVHEGDHVLVRLGRQAHYGDLVLVRSAALEVTPWEGETAPTIEAERLSLWRYRPEAEALQLWTSSRHARLRTLHANQVRGIVVGVLRRSRT